MRTTTIFAAGVVACAIAGCQSGSEESAHGNRDIADEGAPDAGTETRSKADYVALHEASQLSCLVSSGDGTLSVDFIKPTLCGFVDDEQQIHHCNYAIEQAMEPASGGTVKIDIDTEMSFRESEAGAKPFFSATARYQPNAADDNSFVFFVAPESDPFVGPSLALDLQGVTLGGPDKSRTTFVCSILAIPSK